MNFRRQQPRAIARACLLASVGVALELLGGCLQQTPAAAIPSPAKVAVAPPPAVAPAYTPAQRLALAKANAEFERVILPFVDDNCYDCHGDGEHKGGLALDSLTGAAAMLQHRAVWTKVLSRVRSGEMPPRDGPDPKPAEVRQALLSIDAALSDLGDRIQEPARLTVRRLNRVEYVNTVRDLLGLPAFNGGEDFPKDENGDGFDNNADLLTVSPLLFEQYLKTADQAVEQLLKDKKATARLMITGYPKETFYNKAAYAHQVLAAILPRAYRRPVSQAELDRVYKFVALSFAQNGEQARNGLGLALRAILVDPNFLFRVELDDAGSRDGFPDIPADYQLADRLSYFLWSSMPDAELFGLAASGRLHDPAVLRLQVRRMLLDPKAAALSKNFAGQWLLLRNLDQSAPNAAMFPQFNRDLRESMRRETEMFFATVVSEDRSIMDFIDGRFTFVNGPLAKLYGIPGVTGPEFQRVTLTGNQRGGILTQASVLTVTSNPTRTSPVQRGKWILDNILNQPPPAPPDNVPALDDAHRQLTGTMRQKMAQHRTDPNCAVCHQAIDPLGLALENYDPIGAWRDKEGGEPIDVSAVMPNGRAFNGAQGLKEILRAHQDDFRRCLVEKMLIYSLGRGLDYGDRHAVDRICSELARDQDRFSSLILAIASSDLFCGPAAPSVPARLPAPVISTARPAIPTTASASARPDAPALTQAPRLSPTPS
jgi:mono/diheme cytochrome c family protein